MQSNAKAARIAGLLYLVVSIPGFFSPMYIPSHFLVSGDATVTLMLVSIPISLVNVMNELAALILIRGANFLAVFDKSQRGALALLFLKVHGQGLAVAEIFWGLWLIPLAYSC